MATDFLTDENDDLLIRNGDFVLGVSDEEHIDHIMRSNPGDILEDPLVGVGIHNFLNSSLSRNQRENFIREVRLQLEADGAKGVKVKFDKEITVEGRYE